MPRYSKKSKSKLDTCDDGLQVLFNEVIKEYDCTIIEGHRKIERQQELFKQGKSKIDGINKKGKHNYLPSKAVDVAPYPINFDDAKRFYHFAGFVLAKANQLEIKVRWGGDWDNDKDFKDQSFNDLVHWELR